MIFVCSNYSKLLSGTCYEFDNTYVLHKTIYYLQVNLSPLEIQELDAIGKNTGEQNSPSNMSNSNNS